MRKKSYSKPAALLAALLAALVLLSGAPEELTASAALKNAARQTSTTSTEGTGSSVSSAGEGSSAAHKAYEANAEAAGILDELPEYSGEPYVAVNENVPTFTEADLTEESFEEYSALDTLGRAGEAYANVGIDLMPTQERESISSVKPTGWQTVTYDIVEGGYLYNRCHLIGYQLTAENANECNLITGTRYLNVEGMLPFENMIADYVEETDNHVLYRVTPVYDGDNLVASGVLMEALSVEDGGEGISFYVYCYNVQPGITIDYATGDSEVNEKEAAAMESGQTSDSGITASEENASSGKTTSSASETAAEEDSSAGETQETMVWVPTGGGTKYHSKASCSNMKNPQQVTLSQAKEAGYTACKKCW